MVRGRDRRRAVRRQPDSSEPVSRVRVRAGRELSVVDISSAGVLVEGEARLLPGTHLEVHVVANGGRTLVRSRVMRASVAHLRSDRVLYRAALAFEQPVDLSPAPLASKDPFRVRPTGRPFPVVAARCRASREEATRCPVSKRRSSRGFTRLHRIVEGLSWHRLCYGTRPWSSQRRWRCRCLMM